MGLAKVTIAKKFGENRSLCTCSGVAAYYAATPLHVHNDVFSPNLLTIVTLARPKYELSDDGHRPKHMEEHFSMNFNVNFIAF